MIKSKITLSLFLAFFIVMAGFFGVSAQEDITLPPIVSEIQSGNGSGQTVTETPQFAQIPFIDEEYKPLPPPGLYSASAVVMDAATGKVLFEKNPHEQRPMASTTKLMTALVAIESGRLDEEVTITEEMVAYWETGSTIIGLKPGDRITLGDLVAVALVYSANDATQCIAFFLGGSYEGFAGLMNKSAAKIGMTNTNFVTPSGLDSDGHYTTAYDMALLSAHASKNPKVLTYTSMKKCTVYYGDPPIEHTFGGHNYVLEGAKYGIEGCDGLKTGYTRKSGSCLVSHVKRGGVSLVCASLGAGSTSGYCSDHKALYDYAFSHYKKVAVSPLVSKSVVDVIGGQSKTVSIIIPNQGYIYIHDSMEGDVTEQIYIEGFVYAPVEKNQVIGSAQYFCMGQLIAELPVVAAENVESSDIDWLSAYIQNMS